MTENEAIKELEKFQLQIEHSIAEEDCCEYGNSGKTLQEDKEFLDAFDVAITALKEIQQYRAMNRKLRKCFGDCDGLLKAVVDEICYRISVKEPTKLRLLANEDADMWDAYRAVGTVEECQEAVEKQKPQKALIETIYGYGEKKYRCPECGETLMGVDIFAGYCKWCGQAIIN